MRVVQVAGRFSFGLTCYSLHIFHHYPQAAKSQENTQRFLLLCSFIASVIRERLEGDLQAGKAIQWSNQVRIFQDGMELPDRKGKSERLLWSQLARVAPSSDVETLIESGPGIQGLVGFLTRAAQAGSQGIEIWVRGENAARARIAFGEPNFHPAMLLVQSRLVSDKAVQGME